MAGRIPENILEDILGRVDIVEVISGYIPLKRAGRNFRALCPFHHEKTPSFMVSADRQIYHCFGCSAGGNAFNFLMQYERMEFLEAVEALAKKVGISLPEVRKQDAVAVSLNSQLYKINELTADFYKDTLSSPPAGMAKSYLTGRGLNDETLRTVKIGFAPDKWDSLISHLRTRGISLSLIEKAGLILAKERGGYYDRFRNRIIFPIFDVKSRVIAFGARVMPGSGGGENALPKYVNSPESPIYVKGKNLYGLNFARDAVRDNDGAVIVEGYLDFIVPYQAGLNNIIASLGTALTYEQARLIKRYTHNITMVYDPDTAGEMATLRSLDIFVEEGMNVKVVSLPKGLDPDLFVRKCGIDAFRDKIASADNLFDYKLKVLKSRYNRTEIEGKAGISSEMLTTINKFKNEVLKSEYIKKLAEELSVEESALWQEERKIKTERFAAPEFKDPRLGSKAQSINPTEKLLLKLMLEEGRVIQRIRQVVQPSDFQDERVSRIVSIMFDLAEQGKSTEPNSLLNYLDDASILPLVCESAVAYEALSVSDRDKILDDCIKRLKHQNIKIKKQRIHEQIKRAQAQGDDERVDSLMRDFHHLVKEREE